MMKSDTPRPWKHHRTRIATRSARLLQARPVFPGGIRPGPWSSIDLVIADPPINIGYDNDIYDDRLEADAYLDWTRSWGREVVRALKPDGTFWLAIGDEYPPR